MKTLYVLLAGLVFFSFACSNKDSKTADSGDVKLTTTMDSLSYIIGNNLGKNFMQDSLDISNEAFIKGMEDAKMSKSILTDSIKNKVMKEFSEAKQKQEATKMQAQSSKNLADGQKFLDANKSKEGIKVTASGLQYKIIAPGSAKKPSLTDVVTVHYKGTFIDEKVFDSSFERGQPVTFSLNEIIPGWREGIQLIGEGGKIMLYIPSNLAYGENSPGNIIPPNSVLIFEVELIKIGK